MTRTKTLLIFACSSAAIAITLAAFINGAGDLTSKSDAPAVNLPEVRNSRFANFGMTGKAASSPFFENQLVNQPTVSKAAQIDKLIASGSPDDANEAAFQLDMCINNRGFPQEQDNALEVICGDITPGQLTLRSRLAEKAARAGIRGAAVLFTLRAPDGRDSMEVWNDPAYREWRDSALELLHTNGKNGDLDALGFLQSSYLRGLQGDNRIEAIKYASAYNEAMKLNEPYKSNADLLAEATKKRVEFIDILADGLDKNLVRQAIDDGKTIINKD